MQQGSVKPSKFQTQRQGNLNKNPIASKLKYVSIALLQSPFPNLTIYTIVPIPRMTNSGIKKYKVISSNLSKSPTLRETIIYPLFDRYIKSQIPFWRFSVFSYLHIAQIM